jgi:hypothetical protein
MHICLGGKEDWQKGEIEVLGPNTNCDYPSVSINRVTVSAMSVSLCLHKVLMSVSCVTAKRTYAFTDKRRWIIRVSMSQFKCMRKRKSRSEICR